MLVEDCVYNVWYRYQRYSDVFYYICLANKYEYASEFIAYDISSAHWNIIEIANDDYVGTLDISPTITLRVR